MRKQFKKTMAALLSAAMVLTLGSGTDLKLASAEDEAPAGYQAYIGFQTSTYDFRDPLSARKPNLNFFYNGKATAPMEGVKTTYAAGDAEAKEYAGVDPIITADGTYTIRYENFNLGDLDKIKENMPDGVEYAMDGDPADRKFNMVYITTGLPKEMTGVTVTATSFKVDDKELLTENKALSNKTEGSKYQNFYLVDAYSTAPGASDGSDTPLPTESMEVTFQIAGVDWTQTPVIIGADASGTATESPAPSQPPASDKTAPPKQKLSKAFDIYLTANVSSALSPEEKVTINGEEKKQGSAIYGTEAFKASMLAAGKATEKGQGALDADGNVKPYFVTDEAGSLNITETGEYKLTVTAQGDSENLVGDEGGAVWLPTNLTAMPDDFKLTGKEVVVTAANGDVKGKYVWTKAAMYKDGNAAVAKEGDIRIGIVNQWAVDKDWANANPLEGQTIPVAKGDKITFDFFVESGAAPKATPKPTMTAPPASSKYNAYLGFQMDNYAFRNHQEDKDYGLKSTKLNYKTDIGYWGVDNPNAAKPKEALLKYKPTAIKDAEMTKNQQYTVSMTGLNLQTLKGNAKDAFVAKKFLMLFVSTDIPLTMKNVELKNATLKIDGKQVGNVMASIPNKGDASSNGNCYQFMISDTYAPNDMTKNCPYPAGKLLSVLPKQSIEITFTLSGVDFDKKTVGPAKGKSFSSGNFKYKVTKASTKSGTKVTAGKVTVTGLTSKGKKAKKLTLKDTVSKSGGKFTITTLTKNSFKGAKKVKTITLNKKITKLPANVFAKSNCKKLTTVSFKTALKSVNKNAFKGLKKIKVKGKKAAANKKKIKKACKKLKVK